MKLRTQLAGVVALAAALPAFSQVKINDALTVSGWATGSYQYTKPSPGTYTDSLNVDAAMLSVTATPAKKTTVVASVLFRPSGEGGVSPSGSELTLLDAYVTYAASDTVNLTAGKFLSYLGYESFYADLDNMITLANQALLAPIPGYHTGAKIDVTATKTDTFGFSIADAEYQKPGYAATSADGELKHNGGFEAYYTNTAVAGLQLWLGYGYQTKTPPGVDTSGITPQIVKGKDVQGSKDVSIYDAWASYVLDKNNDTLAVEEIYKDGGYLNKGSNWLVYFLYNVPDSKVSSWFCVSGEDVSGGASYVKYSVAPAYTFNPNLSFRLQYSYTNYSKAAIKSADFMGAQVVFKF